MTAPYFPQQPSDPAYGQASAQPQGPQQPYAPGYQQGAPAMPSAPGMASPYGGYAVQPPMVLVPAPLYPVPVPAARQGPARPGTVTGACVLAIISGSLGLVLGLANIFISIDFGDKSSSPDVLSGLFYFYAFGVFFTAVALLAAGITFIGRNGYPILLGAAISQAVLTIARDLVIPLMPYDALGYHSSAAVASAAEFNPYLVFEFMVGTGLATATICLLVMQSSKAWRKEPPASDFIEQNPSPTGV